MKHLTRLDPRLSDIKENHMAKKAKKPSPVAVLRAIHDILYLDMDESGDFHNPDKEWQVEFLETIADAVDLVIPRPTKPTRIK